MKRAKILLVSLAILAVAGYIAFRYVNKSNFNPNPKYTLDQPLDSLNGVIVYYNGMVGRSEGRNTSPDGYNIGMKHQCVEFVKRYYYQQLHHKMPDSYGNAKDFFDASLPDSSLNVKRGLLQFSNGSISKPRTEDLLIFDGHAGNPYGHVAIIATVSDSMVCIIQQNPGPFASSRDTFGLKNENARWTINSKRALGWLRKDSLAIAAPLLH
jgi:surface antigen